MNELDDILLEQLNTARRISKKMKKARRVMGPDPTLLECQKLNSLKQEYLEYMVSDKTLLHKKIKKKKQKQTDILARSFVYEWYRNAVIVSNVGYNMMADVFQAYMSYFKKGN